MLLGAGKAGKTALAQQFIWGKVNGSVRFPRLHLILPHTFVAVPPYSREFQ